eukprot:jgi/Chrzof1/3927/Cz13g13200.t1
MDDLWRLDLQSMMWQQLHPEGTTPHARCSTVSAAVDHCIFYFGGAFYGTSGGLEMLRDVHCYDTKSNWWVVPSVQGELPKGRNASTMVPLRPQAKGRPELLLYGGWKAFVETYNDTFIVSMAAE